MHCSSHCHFNLRLAFVHFVVVVLTGVSMLHHKFVFPLQRAVNPCFLSLILGFDIVITLYLKAIWSLISKMCFSPIGGDCYSSDVWDYTYLSEGAVRRRLRFHYSVFDWMLKNCSFLASHP